MGTQDPSPVGPALYIRRMGLQDLPYVVETHRHHFPDGFFAKLGPRFLTRYYRTFLDGPLATALVAEVDDTVVGYITGVLHGPEHRHLMLKHHGTGLALAGAGAMVRHPTACLTFLFTRVRRYAAALRRYRKGTLPSNSTAGRAAVLSHVVVSQPRRRRGIGSDLVERFLSEARESGCTRACLVTLDGPGGAGHFYERRGWRKVSNAPQADGRVLLRYERDLYADGTERAVGGGHA